MTSHGDLKTMDGNAMPTPTSFLYMQEDSQWYSTLLTDQGEWDRVAELMMIKFGESGHPIFRATSPLSRGTLKSKGGGKLSIYFCADGETIVTVFRKIISVNQLSIHGAVSDLCDEYRICQARTGRSVLAEQSDPLFGPASLETFDLSSCTRKLLAKVPRTSGKVLTTKSCD